MSNGTNAARGYQRSWKNLLINKEYQLRFTLVMVLLSAVLLAGLGFWVQSVAQETTAVGITRIRGEACPKVPEPVAVQAPANDPATENEGPATAPTPDTLVPAAAGSGSADAPALDAGATGEGSASIDAPVKRTRVMIDESSITMNMTLPANFADQVTDHWKCELRQAGAINDLQRGESKIRIVMVLTSVVLIIGLAFYGIKMTHKVAGPLFKVSLYLNKMRDGRFDKVWNLRKGDQLIDFYEHFKAAHAGVVTLQQGDIAALHAFIAAADAAHQASPMSADVVAKVDELRVLVTKKEKSLE
ncbi:MAG: hypothetical protein KBG15_20945 [Kofleriaceae bacterium]|nr:hypothetical protein [Kofleriaceae bacterium]